MLKDLEFDLGEFVYLVSGLSYITAPKIRGNPDAARKIANGKVIVSDAIQIIGVHLGLDLKSGAYTDKIWYDFPGGGNCDGSNMFRTIEEAQAYADQENGEAKGGDHG